MTRVIDNEGRQRVLRPGEVLRDGERIVVPILAMDYATRVLQDVMGNAVGHQHFAGDSEAQAALQSARDEYEAWLTNAWRGPGRGAPRATGSLEDAYANYEHRLVNSWRRSA